MATKAENEIQRTLGKIEATLVSLSEEFKGFRLEQAEKQQTLETRVSALEKWRSYTIGLSVAAGFVIRYFLK